MFMKLTNFEVYQSIIWVVKIHFEICPVEDLTTAVPTSKCQRGDPYFLT